MCKRSGEAIVKNWLAVLLAGCTVAAIPLTVMGMNIYALMAWMDVRGLKQDGVITMAVVTAKDASASRNSTYRLTLRYEATQTGASASTWNGVHEVDDGLYKIAPVNGPVKLYYSANDPRQAHIDGNDIYIKYLLYALVADILLAVALIVLFRFKNRLSKAARQ